MNEYFKTFVGLILLSILSFAAGNHTAEGRNDSASPNRITRLLALEPPELTAESLTVSITATGPVQYLQPVLLRTGNGVPMLIYVDMPNTHNTINAGRKVRINLTGPGRPVDSPVSQVVLSQFQREPPMSRIVFYVKGAIQPVIAVKGNSLRFQFPRSSIGAAGTQSTIDNRQKPALERSEETIDNRQLTIDNSGEGKGERSKQGDGRNLKTEQAPPPTPTSLTGIETVFEPHQTQVRLQANRPLNLGQVVWSSLSRSGDGGEILDIHLFNTTVSEALRRGVTAQQRGIIRGITLEVREGPPPLCTVHIHLARRLPYEVKDNTGVELRFIFENPLLERTVTIKSENEELRKLLFTLFKLYGANFIADKEVNLDELVTFNLEGVPLRVALDQILNSRGYGYKEIENGILRIMPIDKLEQAVQPTEASKGLPKVLLVKTFRLEHAPVATVRAALETFKSPDGKIVEDERTQTILFMDTEEQLAHVGPLLEEMVQTLDQTVPTVAPKPEPPPPAQPIRRVILLNYANPEQIKEMLAPYLTPKGEIQPFSASAGPGGAGGAGATGGGGAEGGAAGGVTLGQPVGRGGYLVVTDYLPESIADIERAVVELDVPTPQVEIQVHVIESIVGKESNAGVNWTGVDKERKATFSVSNAGGQLQIGRLTAEEFTAVLNALATQSDTRLLSNPRITVVENKLAQFHSGEEVPFRKIVIQQGIEQVEVVFKSVGIVLTVMAQVKSDERISLLVNAQVSSVGERPPGGEPSISTRNASTQMLVPDGDTVVIGGLTSDRMIETMTKVPILGYIPLIGGLFSSRQYTKTRNEITIYLTPHIVQP